MSLKDSPQYYHEVLKRIPPRAQPPFEDDAMQARVWGRRWGVYNDVGPSPALVLRRRARGALARALFWQSISERRWGGSILDLREDVAVPDEKQVRQPDTQEDRQATEQERQPAVVPRQPFNLIFSGPAGDVLRAGLYAVEVEDGPTFDLYVMPVFTPKPGHQDYQSSFN